MERKIIGPGLVFVLMLGLCTNLGAKNMEMSFWPKLDGMTHSHLLPKEWRTPLPPSLGLSQKGEGFAKAPAGAGAISGHVTKAAGGGPISGVVITARQLTCPYHSFQDTTGADGSYLIGGLTCGKYSVRTTNDSVFVDVYWNDKPVWGTPDTISVSSSGTTANIDFSLRIGGKITGTIKLNGSFFVLYTFVFAVDTTHKMMFYDMPLSLGNTASYSLEGLPTGVYKLRTFNLLGYIDTYYDSKSSWVTADPVSVAEGGTASSKNFTLSSGGKIEGSVSAGAEAPLEDSTLVLGVLLQDTLEWFQVAFVNPSGNYSLAGLRSGYWKIFALGDTTYASEFYDNKDGWSSADSILVTSPSTVSGKNFSLEVGGSISGHAYDLGGKPLSHCTVAAYESSLVQLLPQEVVPLLSQVGTSFREDTSSADGSYNITGLRTGDYYVKASADCDDLWYDQKPSLEQADLVHVTMPNNTSDIDFNLPSAFVRGDATGNGVIDAGDVVYLINYLLRGEPAPNPSESADVTCDGLVSAGDVVYLVNYLFKGGPAPCC
ncbi:MAG: dockerin type I domain-containing protein [Candidatus Zixiibacteriota bacterium]